MDDTGLHRFFTRAGQKNTLLIWIYIALNWNNFDCFPTFNLEF